MAFHSSASSRGFAHSFTATPRTAVRTHSALRSRLPRNVISRDASSVRRPARPGVMTRSGPAASPLVVPTQDTPEGRLMRLWIEENGGYVYHSLIVSDVTQCGSRGVITTEDITADVLSEQPLVVVPESLYLTSQYARLQFKAVMERNSKPPLDTVDGILQLALVLAYERNLGADSAWFPYIDALPARAPNAWQMSPQELSAALAGLGRMAHGWERDVSQAQSAIEQRANSAVQQFGGVLGVQQDDVVWALGQVLSRAFGSGQDLALAPYIDMLNHALGAPKPDFFETTDNEVMVYVTSSRNGTALPLQPGHELYISYISACTPLMAFLNFGFVPPELQT